MTGPESTKSLQYHLRRMADVAVDRIDADRLSRAADELDCVRDPAVLAVLPDVQALIAEAVAKEREACARMVDCGCEKGQKAAVIGAKNGADRARACGQYNCGAEDAAAIRKRGEG